ncbi:MAM and LDL-receptor class A domain-containing protein 2-like isoform X2 [Acipenser oxyrinchus oxyrinchus]|uniref:MAM and LDL-receptor class A domain-containing protein 2-like isoform X2 n=1 Tax=Acipenser oxyrinchus oxyrinchus TaxID=40147 RepID=A0AAD8GD75_ACIOX|nr:MAM and LDL-receptor class A domain-containing protein 2-like isoform X2 [Acipenser oxyrinchus oxyrinchus]
MSSYHAHQQFPADRKDILFKCLFPGPCDFEHFACGWIDTSNGLYQWMLEMANISSNPGADHSIGTPYGHFMRVDGGSGGFFSKANLESPVLGPTGLACEMSFWYHLYTFFGVRSTSITLSLLNVTSGTAEILWSAPKKENSDWVNVRLDIGNRPRGFKLLFSASASFSEQDIALDDIQFVGCSVKDHPPGTSHLSCDFEGGLCAWYQDKTDHFEWQRDNGDTAGISNHGPGYDHTTGNGYYMFIATESRQESAYKARLASYPQTPAKKRCVSFWYHIYGSNIGTLNFITKQEGKSEKVRWTRSATQGNKWNFADFHISETNTFVQFIFEAVPGGTQGSIAIDDVVITESINGSCPAERECTFETSRCNLKDVAGGSFNWTRITREISTNTSSPLEDHTLGTAYGFYLSTQIWKQASRNEGRIATRLYKPTPYSGECLQFWYYMKGENIGTFNIYLQKHRQLKALLWNRTGNQGDLWRHGRVTVQSPDSQYQIIFEGVAGTGHEGDIAIDDLLLLNGPCPPDGFCDFETGLCGWLNVVSEDDIDWTWSSGMTPSSTHGPLVDHTTNSALGHYLFIKNNPMTGARKKAHLLSEYMEPSATACLVFWYHMDMISFGKLKHGLLCVIAEGTLTVYIKDYEGLRAIWNAKGDHGKIWLEAQVDYNSSSSYQIVIEGKHGHAMDAGSTSLDDIYIEKYLSCSDMALTTAIPTTVEPTQPASPQDCSFEQGLCNWQQETNNTFGWERQTGSAVLLPENGPLFDHTVGNTEGFYLITSSQGTANEESAVISGPMISDATQLCLSFWYYMFGSSVSTLAVLVHTESHPDSVVWTRRGTQSASWINARVTIRMLDTHKIKFSGKMSSKSHGFIAIDDISVMEGECVSQGTCGFETLSVCNYEQDITADTDWVHTKGLGSGPPADHTYSTDKGYFMAVFGDDLVKRQTAQLLSPEYTPTTESCVRFWYWLAADSTSVFSVHVMQNKELGLDLWALSGNPSQDWDVAQITVSSALHFRIVFKVQLDPAKGSFVALDDVTVVAGACPYTGSCDFEAYQCTWTNSQADDFDWIQANGHFSGPSVDHTTQTPEGKWMYMLAETQRHAPGQRAVFVSERFQRSVASCLTMWYFLSGRDSGTLRIYFRSSATQDDLIFETSDSENTWKQFADNSFGPKGFQVVIEVESAGNGFVAVDDIDLVLGLCGDTAIPAIDDFASCDFEVGTCQWEDTSQGQFIWKRGSNGTASSNTGPSADHTTGTELGWYMAVEANDGDRYSYAVLQSPSMKQASSECLMEFYYHMYGTGIGELSVYLREGSRDTLLWISSGSRGNEWKRAVVGIGRTPGVFQLLLEATRTFSVLGDIAVDDIHFQNCYLREPQATCPEGTFKCSNSACIEMSRICDFSDDCGDRSDELDCELNGFKGRCSFENGLCSWENSDLDTPGYDWLRQQGQSAVWKTEPPRDHTRNSAAGKCFYVIAQGTNQNKGDTSLIQSSTLLPSTSCTVRFYYYIHGKDDGVLYVKLRSSASGGGDSILWVRDREVGSYWERAEITFSSPVKAKIVLEYTYGSGNGGQAAVDDISFSDQCVHDNENSILPPSPPPTAGPSTTPSPCQVDQFFCSKSESGYCIPASSKCDYSVECPMGEDEENCGPCTFEHGQCGWNDQSSGRYVWQRQKAGHMAEPGLDGPNTDHTTGTGYYMYVEFGTGQFLDEALLISPHLPTSSPYCQIHFHFHMYGLEVGTLHMVVEKSSGSQTVVWSHWNSTGNHWNAEYANVGEMKEPYRILFISQPRLNLDNSASATDDIALDDISFRNCENSYQPPALPSYNCTFETDMCGWVQGVTDNFDWQRRSGPTETHNTGPTGDHTTGSGNYLYIESSNPRKVGDMAQLRSPLLAPTGPDGYCVAFWYHMFGATVGSLSMYLRRNMYESKTLVWQRRGTIEDEWQVAYRHVTLQDIHEIVFEATVGGAAGDISIDDISFTSGSCPPTDLCDFEENDCNWIQATDDDCDWARGFGRTPNSDTGPSFDHTTNTATGYYLYLKNSNQHRPGQIARISTPEYSAGSDRCLQFWYHMYGAGIGTLNVYKHDVSTANQSVLFSQQGNQGVLWRFAQASLYQSDSSPFRITFEGITGATVQGDMALDDILVSNGSCIPPGFCDFEINLCGWTNIEVVDEGDWLRSKGASPNMNTGPSVDHTTDSGQGYYIYVDHSQGYPGDRSMLVSEIFPSAVGGRCLTFWYHMYGQDIGTLTLYSNNRTLHESGNTYGDLIWSKSGSQGNAWLQGIATVDFLEPYWFIFVYIKGTGLSGDVAIDDIELHFESCSLPPPTTDVPTVPPTYAPTANDCDFEEDPCSWQQDPHNDFDWLRQQGSALSGSIGPAGDHTTGSARGGQISNIILVFNKFSQPSVNYLLSVLI